MSTENKVALIILDGWGLEKDPKISAISAANIPFTENLFHQNHFSTLETFGLSVGLPEGQMGNSEVGHLNIGAGRVIYQELARINKEIEEKRFFENQMLIDSFTQAKQENKCVHLLGLLSDGGVHSHINHLKAIIELTEKLGLEQVYLHCFLDGRDTDPHAGIDYIEDMQLFLKDKKAKIVSLIGRYFAMDRDHRWERIAQAYELLVHGRAELFQDPIVAMNHFYDQEITDEFIPACLIQNEIDYDTRIKTGDTVFFYNFRTDRCRELVQVLSQEDFPDLNMYALELKCITMTRYDDRFQHINIVFEKEDLLETLGEVLSACGKTQLRIAETEKYPHVTFFFNGGREQPFVNEYRIIVPSPKVSTYDLQPEMSAYEIKEALMDFVKSKGAVDFICVNFANADMVGHTGVFSAAKLAVEAVDDCLSDLVPFLQEQGYSILIIADHGNSDCMVNPDGSVNTAHSLNPVPCCLVTEREIEGLKSGKLADIAPTILDLLKLEKPASMNSTSLIIRK